MIYAVHTQHTIVVLPAGNGGLDLDTMMPPKYGGIPVGGLAADGREYDHGPGNASCYGQAVDLAAAAEDITKLPAYSPPRSGVLRTVEARSTP
ncbi:MAG: hypothetical protein H7338_11550 [Candidatus Sericytochromatia bacterium]|nr:hypothetical protein [Candidatus Sericytochromatia bacterium]